MSLAQLQTALDNLDSAIVTLSAAASDDIQASFNGASYTRQDLSKLIAARRELQQAIAADPSNTFETFSRWVP